METERQETAEAAPREPAAADAAAFAPSPLAGALRGEPRQVLALQRKAGNRATTRALRAAAVRVQAGARRLARIGYPLGKPVPAGAPSPLKDEPDHREWRKTDFHAFWEQDQGRKLSESEKKTIDRGCIGITANNLEGSGKPSLAEFYDDFDKAHAAMVTHNDTWWNRNVSSSRYVMFGMLFWSNQDPDREKRWDPNPSAFVADPATRRIDMSDYKWLSRPQGVNYDFGFWDGNTSSFWHANHKELGEDDPMIVYQSTRARFAKRYPMKDGSVRYGYQEFDRVGYGVAVANNFDPTKGAPKAVPTPSPAPAPPVTPPSPPVPTAP